MKNAQPSVSPLQPTVQLLVKLGSIIVHADEMLSPDGHDFDRVALQGLMADPEVSTWLKQMDAMAFLPKKRRRTAIRASGVTLTER